MCSWGAPAKCTAASQEVPIPKLLNENTVRMSFCKLQSFENHILTCEGFDPGEGALGEDCYRNPEPERGVGQNSLQLDRPLKVLSPSNQGPILTSKVNQKGGWLSLVETP